MNPALAVGRARAPFVRAASGNPASDSEASELCRSGPGRITQEQLRLCEILTKGDEEENCNEIVIAFGA